LTTLPKQPLDRKESGTPTVGGFLFHWMSRILVTMLATLVYPIARMTQPQPSVHSKPRHLLIGAGTQGWQLIEYQEISASASEYLGASNVSRVAFSATRPMLREFGETLREVRPSHYYFDPRSGSQRPLKSVWEAVVIGFHLERYGVEPICVITDFAYRRWRLQSAIVSARSGVVTSLMSPSVIGKLFPHKRIIGPMPFPLSVATLRALQQRKKRSEERWRTLRDRVVFIGMLHEPRKSVIEAIKSGLAQREILMEVFGRAPDGSRMSEDDYWGILLNARLVVSTSSQMGENGTDFSDRNHFIYRFIETTAAGTALAIGPVEGSEHLLEPDSDYIAFSSAEEAVEKISSAWHERGALEKISRRGASRSKDLIESHRYWTLVFE
jgi:hypothetical protein